MPWKTRASRTIMTILTSAVCVLLLVGTSTVPPPSTTPSPTPQIKQYQIGDVIPWYDMEVKILSMERASVFEKMPLRSDDEFLVVRVEFKNVGDPDSPFPVKPDGFIVEHDYESAIYSYKADAVIIDKGKTFDYRFAESETVQATYVFTIQKGAAGLTLYFVQTDQQPIVQSRVSLDE